MVAVELDIDLDGLRLGPLMGEGADPELDAHAA